MDIPCAHTPCIKEDYFFLNTGYIPLVFGNKFWFEFTATIPWNINLEFAISAFECFFGISITLVGCPDNTLMIFS